MNDNSQKLYDDLAEDYRDTYLNKNHSGNSHWFACKHNDDYIYLKPIPQAKKSEFITSREEHHPAIKKAKLLGDYEILISQLEELLNIPLDFYPIEPKKSTANLGGIRAAIATNNFENDYLDKNAIISIPISLLLNPGKKLESTSKITINWGKYDCRLNLGEAFIDENDLTKIDQGGIMLIPQSFSLKWSGTIHPINLEDSYNLKKALSICKEKKTAKLFSSEPTLDNTHPNPSHSSVNFESENIFCLPISEFLESIKMLSLQKSHVTSNIDLKHFSKINIKHKEKVIAKGELIELGNGYGVLIETRL